MKAVVNQFQIQGQYVNSNLYGEGHINDTYLVETDDNGKLVYYILQRINHRIFKDINLLMNNIVAVTTFIRNKVIERGGNPDRESLTVIPTVNGDKYYHDETGYYRMYLFITDATSYQTVESPEIFYNSGYAIGKFQSLLYGFDTSIINDVIPNFHNTPLRYETFCKVVSVDKSNRVNDCKSEIDFINQQNNLMNIITNAIDNNEIPLRVTHNDTKLNNIMIDNNSLQGLCLIDLDTIMKGSLLYDFGDAIRFGANTAKEDETNLDKVHFNFELFKTFTEGFIKGIGTEITDKEIELLHFGAILMTLECGMRFLTDYIEGDVYFKIHRPLHNLERAKNQIKLVSEMLEQQENMKIFIKQLVK